MKSRLHRIEIRNFKAFRDFSFELAGRHLLVYGGNAALDAPTNGILKCQRRRLRQLVSAAHIEQLRKVKLIDDILACTDRVLNPAAHAGDPPLYKKEVEDALALIKQLETGIVP